MSMLAEPRRRQKWSLNPRGNLWSNDDSKFGQKLMEKMGWKSGDGLGAQNQGITGPIALNANYDNKGLGHKGGDDDVWLTHKDNFDDVLASLHSEHKSAANSDEESKVENKTSLRETSKKSRKRVHYEKFTRGKDLSGYSQTDLSCILGTEKRKKRKIKHEEEEAEKLKEEQKAKEEEAKQKQAIETKEPSKDTSGLVVIQGGSINDYFKMKMQQMQAKRAQNNENGDTEAAQSEVKSEEIEVGEEKPKEKKKKKKDAEEIVENEEDVATEKKKKKKKSSKGDADETVESEVKEKKKKSTEVEIKGEESESVESEVKEKKKKKKKKSTNEIKSEGPCETKVEPVEEKPYQKFVERGSIDDYFKMKMQQLQAKRASQNTLPTEIGQIKKEPVETEDEKPKKKKSAKNDSEDVEIKVKPAEEKTKEKKKKKKSDNLEVTEEKEMINPEKKKKKKSSKPEKEDCQKNEASPDTKKKRKSCKKDKTKVDLRDVQEFKGANLNTIKGYRQ